MTTAGRNDPCPCGSGKKYKKCCLAKDEAAAAAVRPPPPPPAPKPRIPWRIVDREDPLDPERNLIIDLVNNGQLDEAEAAAAALRRDHPEVYHGLELLGFVCEARGDNKRAADYYRQTADFMQTHPGHEQGLINFMRAQADKLDPPPT